MRTFKDFMRENMSVFVGPSDPRTSIAQMYNLLTGLEPKEVADSQDLLIQLRDLVDDILSGKRY
ncbi:MAG: hypothetical protein M0R80_01590 [Proteobacteria bacterium]|jgi:hypothetical protein|nr:hypothetical protein [Pseudomonadota bacterium]